MNLKMLLPYIIFFVFIGVLITSIIYLSRKTSKLFKLKRSWPPYVVFSLIALFMMAGVSQIQSVSFSGHLIFVSAAVFMGYFLIMVLSFLATDLVNWYFKFSIKRFTTIAYSLTIFLFLYSLWSAFYIKTKHVEIPVKNLNKELTFVHLTDVHIGHFRNNGFINDLVKQTNEQNADAIFITGDYLNARIALKDENFEPLKELGAPVFFVEGNHDEHTDIAVINQKMREVGVKVLENEVELFKGIQIVGLNHMLPDNETFDMHASPNKPTVKKVLPTLNINDSIPSVLLHHAPNGIKYANEHGIDLYLAGHTHAGQMFPFNYLSNFIFEYNRGLHDFEGTKVFVSEGVGTAGPPMRLGTQSEIVVIKLVPDKS